MEQFSTHDVAKLIMQFCHDNKLEATLKALQQETGIKYNALSPNQLKELQRHIEGGNWQQVLKAAHSLALPSDAIFSLYSQIIKELILNDEHSMANIILNELRQNIKEPRFDQKFDNLEQLCLKRTGSID